MKLFRKVLLTYESIKIANLTLYSGPKTGSDPPQRPSKIPQKDLYFRSSASWVKLCRQVLLTYESIKNANLTLYSGPKTGSDPPQRPKQNTPKGPLFQVIRWMKLFSQVLLTYESIKNANLTLY